MSQNESDMVSHARPSICIALVHNNDIERLEALRPNLKELAAHLAPNFKVEIIEVSHQGPIVPNSFWHALKRDIVYTILAFKWRKYCLQFTGRNKALLMDILNVFKKYLRNKNQRMQKWQRSSAIEAVLSDKHIQVWDRFLESGNDVLCCFEDDAVFFDKTISNLSDRLSEIFLKNPAQNIYMNLSGGVDYSALGLEAIEDHKDENLIYFNKPVTNTTCVYVADRALMNLFKMVLIEKPSMRLIGADWMTNAMFIELEKSGNLGTCIHTQPPPRRARQCDRRISSLGQISLQSEVPAFGSIIQTNQPMAQVSRFQGTVIT